MKPIKSTNTHILEDATHECLAFFLILGFFSFLKYKFLLISFNPYDYFDYNFRPTAQHKTIYILKLLGNIIKSLWPAIHPAGWLPLGRVSMGSWNSVGQTNRHCRSEKLGLDLMDVYMLLLCEQPPHMYSEHNNGCSIWGQWWWTGLWKLIDK